MENTLTNQQEGISQRFQAHIDAEIRGDLDTTLSTMTSNPHIGLISPREMNVNMKACNVPGSSGKNKIEYGHIYLQYYNFPY